MHACMQICRPIPLLLLLLFKITYRVQCFFAASLNTMGASCLALPIPSITGCNVNHCCRSPVDAALLHNLGLI
jgi:hypothetical protein